jgi:hypothetical protein
MQTGVSQYALLVWVFGVKRKTKLKARTAKHLLPQVSRFPLKMKAVSVPEVPAMKSSSKISLPR